jgi:hypothetical protein
MIAILALAGVGAALNLLGRWLILREDQALPRAWRIAICTVPGAELACVVLRGERARIGCGVCALSLVLMLPLAGQLLTRLQAGEKSAQVWAAFGAEAGRLRGPDVGRTEKLRAEKHRKVAELSAYLQEWHRLLEERRGYLCDELPDETRAFNQDAAAYHRLLAVSKAELGELGKL